MVVIRRVVSFLILFSCCHWQGAALSKVSLIEDSIDLRGHKILAYYVPAELLIYMFSFLNGHDFRSLKPVSRGFNYFSQDDRFMPPQEEEAYLHLLETNPKEALVKMSRCEPKVIFERNELLAEKILLKAHRDNMPASLDAWRQYVLLALHSSNLGSYKLLQRTYEKSERARMRVEFFDLMLAHLSPEQQFCRRQYLWEQVAYVNEDARTMLIDAYEKGSDPFIAQDSNKAEAWKHYGQFLSKLRSYKMLNTDIPLKNYLISSAFMGCGYSLVQCSLPRASFGLLPTEEVIERLEKLNSRLAQKKKDREMQIFIENC